MTADDQELLGHYQRDRSQEAFTALVHRHVDLVHSAALRQVRSPQLAEEVAQSVFADLARDAARLKPGTVLTAWLYQVARRTAIDVVRRESRRQARERLAVEMATMNTPDDWSPIEPLLDEAMEALDDTDRAAVLLRYFENKSLREVGQTLGTSDDAAQKRVSRAVDRLREYFAKRGVAVGASGLAVAISTNAVQAAPAGLAAAISSGAALAGAAIATTAAKTIAMTTLQKVLITGGLAVAVGTGFFEARQNAQLRQRIRTLEAGRAASVTDRPPPSAGQGAVEPSTASLPPGGVAGRRISWQSVESPDYRQYLANLRAIGCPEETIRDIIRADVHKLYEDKKRQLRQQGPKVEYWREGPQEFIRGAGGELWGKLLTLDQERNAVMVALGIEPNISLKSAKERNGLDLLLDFLPDESKRAEVLRMRNEVEDRIALRKDGELTIDDIERLRRDAEASIKASLTPEQALQYDLRMTSTASKMVRQLAAFQPTEPEFIALFTLQKHFDDEFPGSGAGASTEEQARRRDAEERLRVGIKAALGPERFVEFQQTQRAGR